MGMVTYLKRLKDQLKEENIAKIREEFDKVKPDEIVNASCRIAHVREQCLGKSTAITLACRRRDTAIRKGWTNERNSV